MPGFEELVSITQEMRGFDRPWYIAGGWAIDLYLGRTTRPHSDVDIAILRRDQHALRAYLTEWDFEKVIPRPNGGLLEIWHEDEWLELPIHEIHAQRLGHFPSHLEFLLNESSDHEWLFRKNPQVVYPLSLIGLRSEEGIPFLSPEVVLLYKAASKRPMPTNQDDFDNVLQVLGPGQREWLRQAIAACNSEHAWLERLA